MSTAFETAITSGAISADWSAPLGPNGGYVAAIVVRAFEPLFPGRHIRSLTCHYLRRPAIAPIELRTEVVREGRRMATARLSGFQDDKEVLTAIAAFSSPGLDVVAEWSPRLPAVEPPNGKWVPAPDGAPTLFRQMHLQPRIGDPPFSGKPAEAPTAGGWIELADPPDQIDAAVVALYTDIWWPPSLSPLTTPAGAPTIDLTIHFRADLPLPADYALVTFETRLSAGGFVEEDGWIWARDGRLIAHSRQLALLQAPSQD